MTPVGQGPVRAGPRVGNVVFLASFVSLACTDDLLPGELVLGADLVEDVAYGEENARLGASVATDGESVLAIAPGVPATWHDGELRQGTVLSTGFTADRGAWEAGQGVLRFLETGEEFVLAGDERALASDPADEAGTVYSVGPSGLRDVVRGGVYLPGFGYDALAVESERVALRDCDGEQCQLFWIRTWSSEPVQPAGESLGLNLVQGLPAVTGAGLAWNDGALCAGDPQSDVDDGAGYVSCDDGTHVAGLVGDHLGQAISGGYAAGEFNKWIVPARTRVVPLRGGDVLALERGAEAQPTSLAVHDGLVVIGQPYEMHGGMNVGAVHTVQP